MKEETSERMVFSSARIERAWLMFLVRIFYSTYFMIVVDQHIANNTAESSVKVVFPQLLDIEIVDVTE